MIGTLGDIVFEANAGRVQTFDGFTRKGSAQFAEHPVLDDKPLLQHTGTGLEEISFSVRLDTALGINPLASVEQFREARDRGEALSLIIGGRVLGRFVITETEEQWPRVTGQGRPLVILVSLSLREFAHGD